MATFTVESRAQQDIFAERLTPKHTKITFGNAEAIHFFDGKPVAVESAGILYHHTEQTSATTKLFNETLSTAPHIRCSASDFDFILGQLLLKAGLPLTRREK
jgi:hypothetical protein